MRKYPLFILFACMLLMVCLVPSLEATELPDNPMGDTITTIAEDDSMVNNRGTITNNYGVIINNYGTVTNNYGLIENNFGTVTNNCYESNSVAGYIHTSHEDSTVENNNSDIVNLYGSVTINEASNGEINFMIGANVTTNNGYIREMLDNSTVGTNNGDIGIITSGTVTTNASSGSIDYLNNGSTVTANNSGARIDMCYGTVGTNNGTITNDYRDESTYYPRWLGDTFLKTTSSGDGWSYNSTTNTLTLNNANITSFKSRAGGFISGVGFAGDGSALIYDGSGNNFTIELIGNNTITTTNDSVDYGIYCRGDLTITGSGSLTVNTVANGNCAIQVIDDLLLSANVTANASSAATTTTGIGTMYGTITIDNGTINATGSLFSLFVGRNDLVISGGALNAYGSGWVDANGDITISGGVINVYGTNASVTASDGDFIFIRGTLIFNEVSASSMLSEGHSFQLNGAELSNITPTNFGGDPVPLNEARLLKATAGGNSSIVLVSGYNVAFNANGGSGNMDSVVTSGEYTLPANGFIPPEGKAFKCWSVNGVDKNPGDKINVTANVNVIATWKNLYTVTYDSNGGTGSMAADANINGEYTLKANGFTAPDGKIFKCWSIGTSEKNPGDKITVEANISVKAVWKNTPAPEPEYQEKTEGGKKVYSNEITAGTDTDVSGIFTAAKTNSGDVVVKSGDLTISFNDKAVTDIGGKTVSLKAEVKTTDLEVENAKAVIEVTLDGSSFSNGKATLTVPFTEEVPSGKVLKVYFINGNTKQEMDATYQDGKVVFSTSHFSKYAIVFEDEASPSSGGGSNFPIWIVVVIVIVVIAAAAAVFFLKKSGKI